MDYECDVEGLPDDVLAEAACLQRKEALKGNRAAFGRAHALECELRRRSGIEGASGMLPIQVQRSADRPWWRLWSRRNACPVAGRLA